jgi:hypothetical protein
MEDQEPKKEPKIVKTTLGELGPQLPIGIPDKTGALQRALAVRKWRLPEEREIGALRAKHKHKNVGKYVSALLAKMCTQLGPHRFDGSQEDPKRMLMIDQMYLGDVLYAYVWLRYKSMGPDMPLHPSCPYCQEDFRYKGDLSTLDVAMATELRATIWDYELREPIKMRNREIRKLTLGPPLLSALTAANVDELNTGNSKSTLIYGSVKSLEGLGEIIPAPGELDDLCKYDIEELSRLMDERTLGPIMMIKGRCPAPACGRDFQIPIEWTTEDFFSTSSQ